MAFCLRQQTPDAPFYNQIMHFTPSRFRAAALTLTAWLLASGWALAQIPPQKPASTPVADTNSPAEPPQATQQRSEHIRVEDKRVVIDEVRVGGETKSITVQPKNGMPTYQVAPSTGERSWKVLGF